MPTNPFINHTSFAAEQDLMQDLMDECIAMHGLDVYYLVREDVDLDLLFGEDELASFSQAYPIEMYLKTVDSFQGQSEFISKFGLVIEDQATFSVSARRFTQAIEAAISRPREGDIIWVQLTPKNRYLFEIKFVEDKEQLFQLGKLYTYELRCELLNYSHERVRTHVPEVNRVASDATEHITIQLGVGTGVYQPEELVYQGSSLLDMVASAEVVSFNETSKVLIVQHPTAAFGNAHPIVGITSNASYTVAVTPSTAPSETVADNTRLIDESEQVIVVRGRHPKRS